MLIPPNFREIRNHSVPTPTLLQFYRTQTGTNRKKLSAENHILADFGMTRALSSLAKRKGQGIRNASRSYAKQAVFTESTFARYKNVISAFAIGREEISEASVPHILHLIRSV